MDIEDTDPTYYDYDEYYGNEYYDYYFYGGFMCMIDYLEIRDGASENSTLIDRYCGGGANLTLPIQIQTTQENVWMRCAS